MDQSLLDRVQAFVALGTAVPAGGTLAWADQANDLAVALDDDLRHSASAAGGAIRAMTEAMKKHRSECSGEVAVRLSSAFTILGVAARSCNRDPLAAENYALGGLVMARALIEAEQPEDLGRSFLPTWSFERSLAGTRVLLRGAPRQYRAEAELMLKGLNDLDARLTGADPRVTTLRVRTLGDSHIS